MSPSMSLNSQNTYEIKVYGQPDETWLGWFGETIASTEALLDGNQMTTFTAVAMDQAGLVGLIRRLHGHGIVLISVRQVDPEPHQNECQAVE